MHTSIIAAWIRRLLKVKVLMAMLSLVLAVALLLVFIMPKLPVGAVTDVYTLANDYVRVEVSAKNGGFSFSSVLGDKLVKADDNQRLLYHNGRYDTSFASFQVTDNNGQSKDYIFGGNYGFLGLGDSKPQVIQDATGINADWSVGDLTFRQRIELARTGDANHGMVIITYQVTNRGSSPVKIKARLLLDTALGSQDYATYQVADQSNAFHAITNETILTSDSFMPANFFGFGNGMTSYTVNQNEAKPYQVAFGHWNNLAATSFAFSPDPLLNFTNSVNRAFETADSAYALYYDLGEVAASGGQSAKPLTTWYGIYSNASSGIKDTVTINYTAPTTLALDAQKSAYLSKEPNGVAGLFSLQAQVANVIGEGAQTYHHVAVAVQPDDRITSVKADGSSLDHPVSRDEPFRYDLADFTVGQTKTFTYFFKAIPASDTQFRKIDLIVFQMPESAQGKLLKDNIIGRKSFYILCPGSQNAVPSLQFVSAAPQVVFNSGSRLLNITGKGFDVLIDKSRYSLIATHTESHKNFIIPDDQIRFPAANQLEVLFKEDMPEGQYELSIDWSKPVDGIPAHVTSGVLKVAMSAQQKYRSEQYGLVAIVQKNVPLGSPPAYEIRTFAGEDAFDRFRNPSGTPLGYKEILIVFRGEFLEYTAQADGKTVRGFKAISLRKFEGDFSNVVTINNSIDFSDGSLSIYTTTGEDGQKILIDVDGDLKTNKAKTHISHGAAVFTAIKDGTEYSLVPYNRRGVRLGNFTDKTISLNWSQDNAFAQTLSGMVFSMKQAELGVIYNDNDGENQTDYTNVTPQDIKSYTVSFSAALDLGFLIPPDAASQLAAEKPANKPITATNATVLREKRAANEANQDDGEDDENEGPAASIDVKDVLFGDNRGYLGFNVQFDVTLPSYSKSFGKMKANVGINTINNWALDVSGEMRVTTLEVEFDLGLIAAPNGAPVPDRLRFFIKGFEPGINVDGFGVLWLTGGGGGIDKIYDTFFASSGIPPLKIMLMASFDVLKILEADAELGLSLRGFDFTARDVKVKNTELKVLNRARFGLDWYPELNIVMSVDATIYSVIRGQGYLALVNNKNYRNFFEFFLRATLQIPDDIWFVGGMSLGGVALSLNNQKIWGAFKLLGIDLGMTYYWGGSVSFGGGASGRNPTFPDLLAADLSREAKRGGQPVYYDHEKDRVLYVKSGTNIRPVASNAQPGLLRNTVHASARLLGSTLGTIESDKYFLRHRLSLPAWQNRSAVLTLDYDAASKADALTIARRIQIPGYAILLYGDSGINEATANANLTFASTEKPDGVSDSSLPGRASLTLTFTQPEQFGKAWEFTTEHSTSLTLYEAEPLPKVLTVRRDLTGGNQPMQAGSAATVRFSGEKLNELNAVSFSLVPEDQADDDPGYVVGVLDSAALQAIGASRAEISRDIVLPAEIPAGRYRLAASYRSDSLSAGKVFDSAVYTVQNSWQPKPVISLSAVNGGDQKLRVQLTDDPANDALIDGLPFVDGYTLDIQEKDATGQWVDTPFNGLDWAKAKNEQGAWSLPEMPVGGSFTQLDANQQAKTVELTPGQSYRVRVTPYNILFAADGLTPEALVPGDSQYTESVVLATPAQPVVQIQTASPATALTRVVKNQESNAPSAVSTYTVDGFRERDLTFKAVSDVAISGRWSVDRYSYGGTFANQRELNLELKGLPDGDHTLLIRGTDSEGDSFAVQKDFVVDTTAPLLKLETPINGGYFATDGTLNLTGLADPEAALWIQSNGQPLAAYQGVSIADIGQINDHGYFQANIRLGTDEAWKDVRLVAQDAIGNRTAIDLSLQNIGLTDLKDIHIRAVDPARADTVNLYALTRDENLNVFADRDRVYQIVLCGEAQDGSIFQLNRADQVEWITTAVEGTASLDLKGNLTLSAASYGFFQANLLVLGPNTVSKSMTFGAEQYVSTLDPDNKPVVDGGDPTPTPPAPPAVTSVATTASGAVQPTPGVTVAPTQSAPEVTATPTQPSSEVTAAPTQSAPEVTATPTQSGSAVTAEPSQPGSVATSSPGAPTGSTAIQTPAKTLPPAPQTSAASDTAHTNTQNPSPATTEPGGSITQSIATASPTDGTHTLPPPATPGVSPSASPTGQTEVPLTHAPSGWQSSTSWNPPSSDMTQATHMLLNQQTTRRPEVIVKGEPSGKPDSSQPTRANPTKELMQGLLDYKNPVFWVFWTIIVAAAAYTLWSVWGKKQKKTEDDETR